MEAVVVGGGVIGASCALALAREGASVTLMERAELAAGASGRNHGLLLSPMDPVLVPMAAATLETYRAVAAEAPVPIRLDEDPIGFLLAAGEDARERASGRVEAEAAASCGVSVEQLDTTGLRAAEPSLSHDLVEGWLLDDGRRLDPAALTASMALVARGAGAEVRRHEMVRSLRVSGDRVVGVVTDEGPLDADFTVVAAGPGSGALLRPIGVALPSIGARGWLVHVGGVDGPARIVERAGWHPLPEEEALPPPTARVLAAGGAGPDVGTLLHPTPEGSYLLGGSRQAAAEPADPAIPAAIAREAARLVPALAEAPVLGSSWGIRPMSPDGRPIVGAVREGLVVATGHGSQGVILGGGTGALVAALVLGTASPFDPAPFDPARFG